MKRLGLLFAFVVWSVLAVPVFAAMALTRLSSRAGGAGR